MVLTQIMPNVSGQALCKVQLVTSRQRVLRDIPRINYLCQAGIFPHYLDSYGLTMIVNFAGQTLFIRKITVTSKFDSIFNHPESDHQASNMPVWVICKVHNLLYLVHLYCGIGLSDITH